RADGRQRVGADEPADDQGVGDIVALLQQIPQDHGDGKQQHRAHDRPAAQVLIHTDSSPNRKLYLKFRNHYSAAALRCQPGRPAGPGLWAGWLFAFCPGGGILGANDTTRGLLPCFWSVWTRWISASSSC